MYVWNRPLEAIIARNRRPNQFTSLLHCSIEIVELVAWRLLPIITIPGISYRKCQISKGFGTGPNLYSRYTQKGGSIYIILQWISIRKIVLLLELWAKSSDLNLFLHSFLHIFCVIKIIVQQVNRAKQIFDNSLVFNC